MFSQGRKTDESCSVIEDVAREELEPIRSVPAYDHRHRRAGGRRREAESRWERLSGLLKGSELVMPLPRDNLPHSGQPGVFWCGTHGVECEPQFH